MRGLQFDLGYHISFIWWNFLKYTQQDESWQESGLFYILGYKWAGCKLSAALQNPKTNNPVHHPCTFILRAVSLHISSVSVENVAWYPEI